MAGTYSGSWPVTLTHSAHGNGSYCLTLTDNGSQGWPHSGPASLTGKSVGGTLPYGSFQIINGTLVATIQSGSDTGQSAGLVFITTAENGTLGNGSFDEVYGGEAFVTGALTFGMKGRC